MKINRKKNSYEIVKLENGAVISEFETIYGIVGISEFETIYGIVGMVQG